MARKRKTGKPPIGRVEAKELIKSGYGTTREGGVTAYPCMRRVSFQLDERKTKGCWVVRVRSRRSNDKTNRIVKTVKKEVEQGMVEACYSRGGEPA